jgi:hypothetical protein
MIEDPNPLDRLLDELAEAGNRQPDPTDHPSGERLSAYAAKELSAGEELEVQEHLAVCRRCRELLLDFASFVETPLDEPREGVADLAAAAEWRALKERMAPEVREPARGETKAPAGDDRLLRSLHLFQALAAVLGALVIGLTIYTVRTHRGPEILQVSETMAFEVTRSAREAEKPIEVHLPCGLRFSTLPRYESYRLEIRDRDGGLKYSPETKLSDGIFLLERHAFASGDYEVRLLGLKGDQAEPIGEPKRIRVLD